MKPEDVFALLLKTVGPRPLAVYTVLKSKLGIEEGQVTPDGRFSLVRVECLGSCGTAPMFQLNDEFHEDLTLQKVDRLLESLP